MPVVDHVDLEDTVLIMCVSIMTGSVFRVIKPKTKFEGGKISIFFLLPNITSKCHSLVILKHVE